MVFEIRGQGIPELIQLHLECLYTCCGWGLRDLLQLVHQLIPGVKMEDSVGEMLDANQLHDELVRLIFGRALEFF